MSHESFRVVVGGAGFVGSNLVGRLLEKGLRRIVVVDDLLSAEITICHIRRSNSCSARSPTR